MKILMMGPPGSGKGTVGEKLSRYLTIPIVSVGQLLRTIPDDHIWKKEIAEAHALGKLAPNHLVAALLRDELQKEKYANGYILDGWGRQISDLEVFDPGFDKVILLCIMPATSINRITARRTCSKCGKIYNLVTAPPKTAGICDVCGGKLVQRNDETAEAMQTRLQSYAAQTLPVIEYLKKAGILLEIDGEGSPDEVFNLVSTALSK